MTIQLTNFNLNYVGYWLPQKRMVNFTDFSKLLYMIPQYYDYI